MVWEDVKSCTSFEWEGEGPFMHEKKNERTLVTSGLVLNDSSIALPFWEPADTASDEDTDGRTTLSEKSSPSLHTIHSNTKEIVLPLWRTLALPSKRRSALASLPIHTLPSGAGYQSLCDLTTITMAPTQVRRQSLCCSSAASVLGSSRTVG